MLNIIGAFKKKIDFGPQVNKGGVPLPFIFSTPMAKSSSLLLFDLAILDRLILGPVPRHFRFEFTIFAPIAQNFTLYLSNLSGSSS